MPKSETFWALGKLAGRQLLHFRFTKRVVAGVLSFFVLLLLLPVSLGAQEGVNGKSWSVRCKAPEGGAPRACRMQHTVVIPETGQRLLQVMVAGPGQNGLDTLLLNLPHGIYLPDGVELRVDDGDPVRIVIHTSDANGAYAGANLSAEQIGAFKRGGSLKVSFRSNAARKVVSIPVSLAGFTAAYNEYRPAP